VRQLDRQIQSQFYERTALSRNKPALLAKGARALLGDAISPEDEIKDPYLLEFLGLRDEYSESDLETSLIRHLETFLLELGGDFCFVGRQRRLRIGDEWYRVDLVFYHRRLRCLVLIDLKLGRFTHADAGQMHTYLGYATEHWTHPGENPPVGLILCAQKHCAQKDEALARYALGNCRTRCSPPSTAPLFPTKNSSRPTCRRPGRCWSNVGSRRPAIRPADARRPSRCSTPTPNAASTPPANRLGRPQERGTGRRSRRRTPSSLMVT
jgi:predicted nuclease of restriction endonuclease-like (RecB) superfamily